MTAGGEIQRGSIYLADFGTDSELQSGARVRRRPVLVVQNDWGNSYGDTTIVVPLSSGKPSRSYPFHVELPAELLGKPGIAMCEQIWTLSLRRLDSQSLAECPKWLMDQVDEALRHSLGLSAETAQRFGT